MTSYLMLRALIFSTVLYLYLYSPKKRRLLLCDIRQSNRDQDGCCFKMTHRRVVENARRLFDILLHKGTLMSLQSALLWLQCSRKRQSSLGVIFSWVSLCSLLGRFLLQTVDASTSESGCVCFVVSRGILGGGFSQLISRDVGRLSIRTFSVINLRRKNWCMTWKFLALVTFLIPLDFTVLIFVIVVGIFMAVLMFPWKYSINRWGWQHILSF